MRISVLGGLGGLRPEERSWVPAGDILDHSLIDDYNRQVGEPGNARGRS